MTTGGPAAQGAPRVGDCLTAAAAALARLPQASPRLESELLLAEATGWPRTRLVAWPEQGLDPEAAARFDALLARRLAGEPLAYIRQRQSFWTLELRVTPDTLIPRPETELLVEIALNLLDPNQPLRVADLGTGSGAIAAAVASERPAWSLIATDRSAAALEVARGNFRDLGLGHLTTLRANWLAPFGHASLDVVLSNPPYVAAGDPHLRQGDLPFEPPSALASGPDGLDAIRRIAEDARRCLKPGGLVVLEHGCDQGEPVRRLLQAAGLVGIETRHDLSEHERVTVGLAPPSSARGRVPLLQGPAT